MTSSPPFFQPAALPPDEADRLAALRRTDLLDSPPEAAFDRLARIAGQLLGTPVALISLVDRDRQWFKAETGLGIRETPRDLAFCAHAILQPHDVTLVPDAAADERFRGNPLVVGEPYIRFYLGAPVLTRGGQPLGTLCVIDRRPRLDIGARETAILKELAQIVADEIELRSLARELDAEARRRTEAERGRERAETEAVRQRPSQSLMRLTGGIAHEFNNLFTGLTLFAENMQVAEDEKAQRQMQMMLDALRRGSRLTAAMQAYAGRQFLDSGKIDVGKTIGHAAEMIRTLHGKATRVDCAVAEDLPPVQADSRHLLAALAELGANAVEAAAPRPAEIRIAADIAGLPASAGPRRGDAGGFVRIAVTDNGPGMRDEVRAQACEPFFTTKPVGAGPGLGLSMAEGFARQSGGCLTIESAPGAGATVALYLPCAAE